MNARIEYDFENSVHGPANAGISGTTRYANCYTKLKIKITELFTRFVPSLSLATTNEKWRLLRMATQWLQQRGKNLPVRFEAEEVPAARHASPV